MKLSGVTIHMLFELHGTNFHGLSGVTIHHLALELQWLLDISKCYLEGLCNFIIGSDIFF